MRPSYLKSFFTEQDYTKICSLFDIGKLEEIFAYDEEGYEGSKVFVKTDTGKFVISSYKIKDTPRPKSFDSIMQEIELLQKLNTLPVPKYIASNNQYIIKYKGENVTAYTYIEGEMPKKLDTEMVYQLGKFLGKFHTLGKQFKNTLVGRREFYDLSDSVMKKMDIYVQKQTNPLLKKHIERIRQGVTNNRLPSGLARGPIHVDLKPVNELFVGETLSGVLDFGLFYRDVLLIDIGKAIMWNCVQDKKVNIELMAHFLEGYERERILPDTERALLKQAIRFAIYSHIYVDYYHVPLEIVPESYTVSLVEDFLPVADDLEKSIDL